MTGGWAALNTLRCELQDYGDDILGRPSGEAVAALALVQTALDAADNHIRVFQGKSGTADLLAAALRAVREGK